MKNHNFPYGFSYLWTSHIPGGIGLTCRDLPEENRELLGYLQVVHVAGADVKPGCHRKSLGKPWENGGCSWDLEWDLASGSD